MVLPFAAAPVPLPLLVIGDTHWGHDRLVELAGRPAEHDELMLQRWREVVGPDDSVLHVGDVVWRGQWVEPVACLPGRIYVVPGNHDHGPPRRALEAAGWLFGSHFQFSRRGWLVRVTHRPIAPGSLPPRAINVHGHIHNRPAPTGRHINVSAEALDYRPARLLDLVDARLAELQGD